MFYSLGFIVDYQINLINGSHRRLYLAPRRHSGTRASNIIISTSLGLLCTICALENDDDVDDNGPYCVSLSLMRTEFAGRVRIVRSFRKVWGR